MKPRPPFDTWPRHVVDERFGFAWYASPAVLVTQTVLACGTAAAAHAIMDVIDEHLARHADEVSAEGGLLIVHDFREMHGYVTEARQVWLARMRQRERGYLRGAVAILPDTPMLKMAAQTVNMFLALNSSAKLTLANEPREVLRRFGVRAPS